MMTCTACTFRRDEDSRLEAGFAITTAPGLYDVVAIIPRGAKRPEDALHQVWKYDLHPADGCFVLPDYLPHRALDNSADEPIDQSDEPIDHSDEPV